MRLWKHCYCVDDVGHAVFVLDADVKSCLLHLGPVGGVGGLFDEEALLKSSYLLRMVR